MTVSILTEVSDVNDYIRIGMKRLRQMFTNSLYDALARELILNIRVHVFRGAE